MLDYGFKNDDGLFCVYCKDMPNWAQLARRIIEADDLKPEDALKCDDCGEPINCVYDFTKQIEG